MSAVVLVLDDESYIRGLLATLLEGDGHKVLLAQSAQEALDTLQQQPVDILLSDLNLGDGLNGIEVVRRLPEVAPDTAAILMTAYPSIGSAVESMRDGVCDYLFKPLRLEQVRSTIHRALENRRLRREVIDLKQMVGLQEAARASTSTMHLEHTLTLLLREAVHACGGRCGYILVCNNSGDDIRVGASCNMERARELALAEVAGGLACIDEALPTLEAMAEDPGCRDLPILVRDRMLGCVHVEGIVAPPTEARQHELAILGALIGSAIETTNLYADLRRDYLATVRSLANAVEAKDPFTQGHADRVVHYCTSMARELGWSEAIQDELRIASMLHDIGKIGISESILLKPGKLTPEEYDEIKRHPEIGDKILEPIPNLARVRRWIFQHHEKWDGTGYPCGLKDEQIEPEARVLIVAEVFDALVSRRSYKDAWPLEKVISFLQENAGTHFAPEMVDVMTRILRREGEAFMRA